MATAVNFIDTTLKSAPSRTVNLPTAQILLTPSAPAFHVTAGGVNAPASITFTATLIDLAGTISFTCPGGTLTNVMANSATLTYANMSAATATVTASITVNGQTYSAPCTISKVQDGVVGANAAYVVISTPAQAFTRANAAAAFSPTSVTLTATPYGGTATYQWQYWTGVAWANVSTGGTAASYTVAAGSFTDAVTYRVQATINGTVYTDQITLYQVTGGGNGINAITGFLTNEATTLAADSSGTVATFAPAGGTFKVFDGITDKTGAPVTYSVASQTGCTVTITGLGVYAVGAMTADTATATLQAVYGGVTIQKVLSLSKSKAGAHSGSSVNDDPMLEDPTAWNLGPAIARNSGTTATGAGGVYYFSNSLDRAATDNVAESAKRFSVDPNKTYNLTANLYVGVGNNRRMFVYIECYDAAGNYVGTGDSAQGPGTHFGGTKSGYTFGGYPTPGQFSVCGGDFGAGTAYPLPARVRTVYIGVWFNYSGDGNSSVEQAAQDIRLTEVTAVRAAVATANAAAAAAQAAAQEYAAAQANLAKTNAQAYADGIVTAEEQRAINDAAAKAEAARVAAVNAAAADATAKANVAATTANADGSIRTPQGALYDFNGGGIQGAIKITLPQSWSDTMMKFTVDIYEYQSGYSCTLDIAGYNYSGSPQGWYSVTARVVGGSNVEYPVFFGHDGTKCCVWIGDAATESWYYPKVRVRDFLATQGNTGAAAWSNGWQISISQSAPTAGSGFGVVSVLDTYPAADWSKIPPKNGRPANNASADIALIGRGSVSISGNTATKVGGSAGWDSDVYSTQGYTGGAVASAVIASNYLNVAFGLNTDPLTDAIYTSIDYAIQAGGDGNLYALVSGQADVNIGPYAVGDNIAVAYDGNYVRWSKNGTVLKTLPATITAPLFFDSSFYNVGAALTNIRFIPQSSVPSDLTLIGRNGTVTGNTFIKTGSQYAWDADCYSKEAYTNGAYVSARVVSVNGSAMLALNTDPVAGSDWQNLDYALYHEGAALYVYGVGTGNPSTTPAGQISSLLGYCAAGDLLTIIYNGSKVSYWLNGGFLVDHAAPPNLKLFMDSSVNLPGGGWTNIRFGPLSSTNWGDLGFRPSDSALLNSYLSISSTGALLGGGGGQVQMLPVLDGARNTNWAPQDYGVVHVKEFKSLNALGFGDVAPYYCVLETMKPWIDNSGGNATQWAYLSAYEVYKRSAGCGAASWGPWVRDLDRNLFTGDLNSTNGAPPGTNVGGTPSTTVESNAANGQTAYNKQNISFSLYSTYNSVGGNYANYATSFGYLTLAASNANGSVSYAWTIAVSDGPGQFKLDTYTGNSVSVSCKVGYSNQSTTIVISCTATDSIGKTATINFTRTITWGLGG